MTMKRATLVAVLASSGCGVGALGPGPPYLEVSGGLEPRFSWGSSGGGTATGLRVADLDRSTLTWRLGPMDEVGGFDSGVRYGTVPSGGKELVPAVPLVSGRRYRVAADITGFGTETIEFVP